MATWALLSFCATERSNLRTLQTLRTGENLAIWKSFLLLPWLERMYVWTNCQSSIMEMVNGVKSASWPYTGAELASIARFSVNVFSLRFLLEENNFLAFRVTKVFVQ